MENKMTNPSAMQRSDAVPFASLPPDRDTPARHREIFSSMCRRLSDSILLQKTIRERELFTFSKTVIWFIRDNMTAPLEPLDDLAGHISDYWRFEVNSDPDSKRKYSYIRLYQMVSLLQNFCREQEREKKAFSALKENRQNLDLIAFLRRYPGTTHRKLREDLHLSSEELQARLAPLKKEGFLIGRRSGEDQYYMLTNDGEALYDQLCIQKKRERIDKEKGRQLKDALQLDLLRYLLANTPIITNRTAVDLMENIQSYLQSRLKANRIDIMETTQTETESYTIKIMNDFESFIPQNIH